MLSSVPKQRRWFYSSHTCCDDFEVSNRCFLGKTRRREINCVVSSLWESNFVAYRFHFENFPHFQAVMCGCLSNSQSEIKKKWNITWHCWGPPCRVGDAVFGLCFFIGVDETAAGKLEFDDGVTVVAMVVMVSGCWVETTIEVDDDLCKAFEVDDNAFVSITLATENKLTCLQCVGCACLQFSLFQPSIHLCWNEYSQVVSRYKHGAEAVKVSASALLITLLYDGSYFGLEKSESCWEIVSLEAISETVKNVFQQHSQDTKDNKLTAINLFFRVFPSRLSLLLLVVKQETQSKSETLLLSFKLQFR